MGSPAPVVPGAAAAAPYLPVHAAPAAPAGMRRIRLFSRSNVPMQFKGWHTDPGSNQWIGAIDGGVNMLIEGGNVKGLGDLGTIDISADRVVIWTSGIQEPDLSGSTLQDERVPWEFYLEGNIVFREGERTVYADRMYYDASKQVGTVLNAEVLTPVDNYEGLLRLRAEVVQRTGPDRFYAQNAFITSSRMGEPGYRLQTGEIYFEDIQYPTVDPITGQPLIDPTTGQPLVGHQRLATAVNDFLFVGPVPIFYWPKIVTDLNDSSYYIRRASLRQDNVYGTQILTHWNGYDLLGIRDKPAGTDLDITLDYLGKRGFGHGGAFRYDRPDFFGFGGHTAGLLDYWGIQDQGTDNLGQGRSNVPPERSYRERLFWQHRQLLPYDLQLSAEAGWISDRNFLEEYYKSEWEELKDESTDVELKRITENRSWSFFAQARINDFFTETEWLPRFDHYWLGQSILNDALTWYEHSSAAYARFRRLEPPSDPIRDGPINYLAWEVGSREGGRFASRQEIDYPFQLGPVKIVPYALGEAAHWGEDVSGEPLDRFWGQAGIRASMPMWRVDPTACSELFNVHGLAHKVVWKAEFSASDADRDLTDLPLYDPLDDNSVEAFRRQFLTTTFGYFSPFSLVPTGLPYAGVRKFDERLYALRTGLQDWVASPSTEIADDLMVFRLGAEQRWQTKRGPVQNQHIIDWVTLDTNITFFPEASRDDFGSAAGLADYDFSWHIGDRLTLLSDGIFDFFNQGQRIVSVGGFLSRPPRGSLYAGFRFLDGPIHNRILSLSYSYWMSPKWVSSFGATVDVSNDGNIGENFSITRIGESLLVSAGFNVDRSRNSVGANLAIEPRFLPKTRLGNVNGAQIPPAGAAGLE